MKRPVLLACLLLIVGCVPYVDRGPQWVHPSASPQQFDRDFYECTRESNLMPRVPYPVGPPPSLPKDADKKQKAEHQRNLDYYHSAVEQARHSEERANQLLDLCMKARGYTRRY